MFFFPCGNPEKRAGADGRIDAYVEIDDVRADYLHGPNSLIYEMLDN